MGIESIVTKIFTSYILVKINILKKKKEVEDLKDELIQCCQNFEQSHDGTIITTDGFYGFLNTRKPIEKLFEYALKIENEKCNEDNLIRDLTKDFIEYTKSYKIQLKFGDTELVGEIFTSILNIVKKHLFSKIATEDRGLLYIIVQIHLGQIEITEKIAKNYKVTLDEIGKVREEVTGLKELFQKDLFNLSEDWFYKQNKKEVANLGNRYIPDVNVHLDIQKIFSGVAKNVEFKEKFLCLADKMLIDLNNLSYEDIQENSKKISNIILSISYEGCFDYKENQILDIIYPTIKLISDKLNELRERNSKDNNLSDYEIFKIRNSLNTLSEFEDFLKGKEIRLLHEPYLLIKGDGGVGKSHLLADTITQRYDLGEKSILLLGQHFPPNREPLKVILELLHINATLDEFLGYINEIGRNQKSRVIIFIDALNEGGGKSVWKEYMAGVIETLSYYNWIGLVLTVRTQYLDSIINDNDFIKEKLTVMNHNGFENVKYEAVKKYFIHYNINHPVVPYLSDEFSNPLFLRLFCEGFKGKEVELNKIGLIDVYENYLKEVNKRIAEKYGFSKYFNIIREVISSLVNCSMESARGNFIEIEEAYKIILIIAKDNNIHENLFDALLSEGILTQNILYDKTEYIYITYERLSDYIYAQKLIEKIDFLNVNAFEEQYSKQCSRGGVMEALTIILPEKGYEIFELLPRQADSYTIAMAFVQSLKWRLDNLQVSEKSIQYINNIIIRRKDTLEAFVDVLITLAGKENSPFNAKDSFKFFNSTSMAERDAVFIEIFDKLFYDEDSSLNRHLDWIIIKEPNSIVSDEVIELVTTIMTWFLISPNIMLRDKTTLAMVKVLVGHINVLINILEQFKDIDDPYVIERLYAVAFGCQTNETDIESICKLADFTYKRIFVADEVITNILVRDFAKNIIDYALYFGAELQIDYNKVTPPYKSRFPKIPTDVEIKKYRYDYKEPEFKDIYWSQNSILDSMKVDLHGCGYGDFGRYIFQDFFSSWSKLNTYDLMKIAIKKIFDMGYNVELHGEYDRYISQMSTNKKTRERIGKKYQWLALYELAAQVTDNYKMQVNVDCHGATQDVYCKGSFEPNLRKIDPTIIMGRIENKEEWKGTEYNNFNMSNQEWLEIVDDIPSFEKLYSIYYDDRNFLMLSGSYNWKEDKKLGYKKYELPEKDIWIQIESYIVKEEEFDNCINKLKGKNFMGQWMPTTHTDTVLFNKEYYWSEAFKFFENEYYCGEEWKEIKIREESDEIISKTLIPIKRYSVNGDETFIDMEYMQWAKPCSELFNGLNLRYVDGNSLLHGYKGQVVCFDSIEIFNKPIGFFIDSNMLNEFLKKKGYKIFWTLLGEKRIIGGHQRFSSKNYISPEVSGIYYFKEDKLIKEYTIFKN